MDLNAENPIFRPKISRFDFFLLETVTFVSVRPLVAEKKAADEMSWADIMGDDDNNEAQDEDDETEATGKTSSTGGVSPTVAREDYSVEDAIAQKAENGLTMLPENLSDEVKEILKSAADTLTAGLFNPPTLEQYAQGGEGDSKGLKAKTVTPGQQPGRRG